MADVLLIIVTIASGLGAATAFRLALRHHFHIMTHRPER